jgi:hypothetical protein
MNKNKLMLLAGATIITTVIGVVIGKKALHKVEEKYEVPELNEESEEEEA